MKMLWENIYQEYSNIEFWKGGIIVPFLVRRLALTNKTKYCHFDKGHDYNTDDYIQLKDAIEGLIKTA